MKLGTVTVFYSSYAERDERLRRIFEELGLRPTFGRYDEIEKWMALHETYPFVVRYVLRYFGELKEDVIIVPF